MKKITGLLVIVIILGLAAFAQAKAEQSNQAQGQNQTGNICKSKCGDKVCDEVVCQAEGCPCAEDENNCPGDCKNNTSNQNQEQNQEQNQGEQTMNQEQNEEQNLTNNQVGQANAEQHRSTVANFVQSLLKIASTTQGSASATVRGIGEQVRVIAQEQNESASTTVLAMEKIQTRSKIQTFLFGSDYKNLGALRSEVASTTNRIRQLEQVMTHLENASSSSEIQAQIQVLEQEQAQIENFVQEQESKFSLFGWLVKLFNK